MCLEQPASRGRFAPFRVLRLSAESCAGSFVLLGTNGGLSAPGRVEHGLHVLQAPGRVIGGALDL